MKHLIAANQHILAQLEALVQHLPKAIAYNNENVGTIEPHLRHVIEFYIALTTGAEKGMINYDNRARDRRIETQREFAIEQLQNLQKFMEDFDFEANIELEANYCATPNQCTLIESNLKRELAYVLDHAIHHMAIIRILITNSEVSYQLPEDFGLAFATIRHNKACAQ